LDVMPTPAMIVRPVWSVGSSPRLAIEREACLSVSGVHVVPPSVVRKTPPLTEAANIVFAPNTGSGRIAWIAPPAVPLGGASALCIVLMGPIRSPGPCD
jgi:hypothetical protein